MQFNSHATSQDMVSLANLFTKQNNTSFPLAEKVIYANMGNRLILTEIHKAYGGWKYDDKNNTDLPTATTGLVSGQSNYSMPLDANTIDAVYVLQEGTTDQWDKLIPLTIEMINGQEAEPSFEDTDGNPTYYRLVGNAILVYPASNYTQSDSLMIEYSRDISTFATTDTTKTAGFDNQFHEAIPVYMAYQYGQINGLPNLKQITEQWLDYLARIKNHYSQKFRDMYPARIRVRNTLSDYL